MERIVVDGHGIEYRWTGRRRDGLPVLVFLHEGLGCAGMWRDFPDRVTEATGLSALVYSRWGYGGSDPRPLPWPIDHMEREGETGLPVLLDALGVGEYVLWGHSDGASVALVAAGHHDDARLLGVISAAAHVVGGEEIGVRSIADALDRFRNDDLRSRLARYHADVDGAFHGWADTWLHPDFAAWTIERYLPGITVPTLVVQGESDQYGTLDQVRRIVDGMVVPPSTLILPDCGHHPHLEQPERMLDATAAFVRGL